MLRNCNFKMNPLKCPKCPSDHKGHASKFNSRAKVVNHLKSNHKMVFYFCVVCNDDFENEVLHRKFHDDFPQLCEYCPAAYKTSSSLLTHVMQHHPGQVGLHSPSVSLPFNNDELPIRGEMLMARARNLGISQKVELVSKDFFVVGLEGGLQILTVHTITPASVMKKQFIRGISWDDSYRKKGMHVGHLATAGDFTYNTAAHQASYDPLNWVLMDPTMNADVLGSFELFFRNHVGLKWSELLIVTFVTYGNEERTAEKVGKAVLMTRPGENTKCICYVFENKPSLGSWWKQRSSLQDFREDFNQPQLFASVTGLRECGQDPVFSCKWIRCASVFLTARDRDAHERGCPIQNDKKAKKKGKEGSGSLSVPCLHCLFICSKNDTLQKHHRSVHVGGRTKNVAARTNPSASSTSRERSRSPLKIKDENISNENNLSYSKVAGWIQTAPLSTDEIDDLVELLTNKTPSDGDGTE